MQTKSLLDANPLVRREMVVLISRLFSGHFQVCGPILRNVILQGEEKGMTGEQVKIGEEVKTTISRLTRDYHRHLQ